MQEVQNHAGNAQVHHQIFNSKIQANFFYSCTEILIGRSRYFQYQNRGCAEKECDGVEELPERASPGLT